MLKKLITGLAGWIYYTWNYSQDYTLFLNQIVLIFPQMFEFGLSLQNLTNEADRTLTLSPSV